MFPEIWKKDGPPREIDVDRGALPTTSSAARVRGTRVEVEVESVCQTSPLFFSPEFAEEKRLPAIRTRRGALVLRLRSGFIEVYTGSVVIDISGNARDMTRAIDALRPLKGPAPRKLRPPEFSRDVVRTLRETRRVHRQLGSIAAVARRLRISRTEVRLRLKLVRVLRRFGPLRSARC